MQSPRVKPELGWLQEIRSFIDPAELRAAKSAPRDYVFGLPHGTAIDEAQLCEEILLPVKERIEQSPAGSLLLTGSTRLRRDGLGGSDPLAGRVGSPLRLGPLTIGERSREPIQLVGQLFDERPESIDIGVQISRSGLVALVQEPGLPGLVDPPTTTQHDSGVAYIAQVTSLSSFESVDVQRVGQLARYLAGRTSTLVNINAFATDVELARQSVTKYLAHLEEALVVVRLPGWRRAKDKSETDRAKLHFFDAGIACAGARMLPAERPDDLGRLVETLLVTDLVRQAAWLQDPPSCYHWRRGDRDEVDLVLEAADGRAICVEVKVAESLTESDFRGIDAFRDAHPDVFHRGFVFYSGRNVQPMGNGRWAIPFAALHSPAPRAAEPRKTVSTTRSRESTTDLWDRILTRLTAATARGAVEWTDEDASLRYRTTTPSGSITIARQVAGDPLVEGVGLLGDLAADFGLSHQVTLYLGDADGNPISSLTVSEDRDLVRDRQMLERTDPMEIARRTLLRDLYLRAVHLIDVIEETVTTATEIADRILDDLESE